MSDGSFSARLLDAPRRPATPPAGRPTRVPVADLPAVVAVCAISALIVAGCLLAVGWHLFGGG